MQLIKLLDPYDIEAVIQPLINDGYTVQCATRVNDCRMLIVLNRPAKLTENEQRARLGLKPLKDVVPMSMVQQTYDEMAKRGRVTFEIKDGSGSEL